MHIHWDKKYETGHQLIDAEHKMLFFLFKKLDVAIKTTIDDVALSRIILEVKSYTSFHFLSEENLMYEAKYPDIEKHVTVHSNLISELNLRISQLNEKREFPDEFLEFLNDWLINHIGNEDRKLAKYIENEASEKPVAAYFYPEYLSSFI